MWEADVWAVANATARSWTHSSVAERLHDTQEAGGSFPPVSTNRW